MNQITELVVEKIEIKGGTKIKVATYATPNKTLYNGLFYIGKALRWLMECKSNNMTRGIQPRDVRDLWKLWNAHKSDFELMQQHSDSPFPAHEFNRMITLPHPHEMMRYKNLKIQRIASELHDYAHVCMSVDSAEGTEIVEMSDYQDIQEAQRVCEEVMKMFIGTGESLGSGKWDTGMDLPALTALGEEVPSGDLDFLTYAEPSKTSPDSGLPDAPDIDDVPAVKK